MADETEPSADGAPSEDEAIDWAAPQGDDEETTERILNQDEIDSLLGFDLADEEGSERTGIRAIINSALVSYERLPMLEIVFDRLVRLRATYVVELVVTALQRRRRRAGAGGVRVGQLLHKRKSSALFVGIR